MHLWFPCYATTKGSLSGFPQSKMSRATAQFGPVSPRTTDTPMEGPNHRNIGYCSSSALETAQVLAEMHRPVSYLEASADSAPGIHRGAGMPTGPSCSSDMM